eukprot:CAMPEP_0184695654 /NCGR_PEP_ID=MMETSP0313-20130426/3226_1 /TAXON_ID=2792 /ORGANISM="Porphyridium aerugineum, Strain SAG 1380-2" /LENGTH=683 /DNA_ID=CAMNT_0027154159 /DNA_START=396 /DNA_END=2447 /DNA_ORIENTATION=+
MSKFDDAGSDLGSDSEWMPANDNHEEERQQSAELQVSQPDAGVPTTGRPPKSSAGGLSTASGMLKSGGIFDNVKSSSVSQGGIRYSTNIGTNLAAMEDPTSPKRSGSSVLQAIRSPRDSGTPVQAKNPDRIVPSTSTGSLATSNAGGASVPQTPSDRSHMTSSQVGRAASEYEEGQSEGRASVDSWVSGDSGPGQRKITDAGLMFQESTLETAPVNEDNRAAMLLKTKIPRLEGRSVLDCVVELLRGTRAQKKKAFMRTAERWIWLSYDLTSLLWKSKKRGEDFGRLELRKVTSVKSIEKDKEIAIDTSIGRKLNLVMNTKEELYVWITGLSCLISKKAKVEIPEELLKARLNYTPDKDSFQGVMISDRNVLNQYIILGPPKNEDFDNVDSSFSMCKGDKKFYTLKFAFSASRYGWIRLPVAEITKTYFAMLRVLKHPNVVRHKDIIYDDNEDTLVIVEEHMARGMVLSSSNTDGAKYLSEDGARDVLRDVVLGLDYLHSNRIVHHGIRPDALFRGGDGTVRLGDFSQAKFYALESTPTEVRSPPALAPFLAPELTSGYRPSARQPPELYCSDIWGLGATLYFLVFGQAPFAGPSLPEIERKICNDKLSFPASSAKMTKKLKDLITAMLVKEPEKRITLDEVKSHPWFAEKLAQKRDYPAVGSLSLEIETSIEKAEWKQAFIR